MLNGVSEAAKIEGQAEKYQKTRTRSRVGYGGISMKGIIEMSSREQVGT